MKKLLLILLFIPLVSFGQEETTINLNKTIGYADTNGMKYLGSGKYNIELKGQFVGKKSIIKKITKQIQNFANSQNVSYRILNTDHWVTGGFDPNVRITFQLINKDGTIIISKDESKKQLLELKEFLDLGIITQDEFDKKAIPLKKILLGN